ncbi:MAG TPA: hypothetical protein VG501_09410, partial [Rhizomicrobium sp.]|nr:hypothetical protein [Rhizomicrobium sp.]
PVWFAIVGVVDLLGLPLLLPPMLRKLGPFERDLSGAMLLFFCSTYIFGFSNANNYSSAGLLLPHLVFIVVVLRQLERCDWRWLHPDWRIPATALPVIFVLSISGNLLAEARMIELEVENWSPLFAVPARFDWRQSEPWHLQLLDWLKQKKIDPQAVNRDPNPLFQRDVVAEFNRDARPAVPMQVIWGWFIEKFEHRNPRDLIEGEREMMRYSGGSGGHMPR